MNLNELVVSSEYSFRAVRCATLAKDVPRGMTGSIEACSDEVFRFVVPGSVYMFGIKSEQKDLIADMLGRGFRNICTVSEYKDDNLSDVFLIDVVFFNGSVRMGELNIYISDKVKNYLVAKKLIDKDKADSAEAYEKFAQSFIFSDGTLDCFAFMSGKYRMPESFVRAEHMTPQGSVQETEDESTSEEANAATAETASEEIKAATTTESETEQHDYEITEDGKPAEDDEKNERMHTALKLYGRDCILFVRADGEGDKIRLIAEKAVVSKQNIPCMKLGYGKISFSTETAFIAGEVKRLLQEKPGYIELWNTYANLEGQFLLDRARAIGMLHFAEPSFQNDEVTLFFTESENTADKDIGARLHLFKPGDMVNLGWTPAYIADPDMTWEEYNELPAVVRKGIVSYDDYLFDKKMKDARRTERTLVEIKSISKNSITLAWDGSVIIPVSPLSLSVVGNEKQIERRAKARERIENGESANPQLGLIIDGNCIAPACNISSKNPLSDYVKHKVFPKNAPTNNQLAAIKIALETPDIAVIQGPPGTGKTTVIKAIIEILNERSDKKDYEAGSVLVTSLQHDAVYNVSKALMINGLPTVKFGKRYRDSEDDNQVWDIEDIRKWCKKIADEMLEKYPQLRQSMQQSELHKQLQLYLSSPDDEKAVGLLEHCRTLPISSELVDRVDDVLDSLRKPDRNTMDALLAAIRRLRVNPTGFMDDGQANALSLYRTLRELGFEESEDEENVKILGILRGAAMTAQPDKELLREIANVRNILLSRCLPPPAYSMPSVNEDVVVLVEEIISSLSGSDDKKDVILTDYYNELTRNPEGMKAAVQSYNFVFAATAQQSMGKDVYIAKHVDINDREQFPKYDTVIVDEAARVTPADLMIPMSQAKRRIILVGDHRQLPHIYDEDIFEAMKNDGKVEHEENIKISMFKHLLNSAKELEKADGVTRTIVLSNQYRTHPLLGNFVNECFYKPHDEAFESPLEAKHFAQPISSKPLIWVDIPVAKGTERKNTARSSYRTCEADYIAAKLKEYLAREDCRDLTFGVITFYSAQVSELRKKLGALADDPRVRIGSVDSFQGMEFDVVFLSVVRTSSRRITVEEEVLVRRLRAERDSNGTLCEESAAQKEKLGMNYYGFLTSENRLCVAISRQKRLLIVVGDKDVFMRNNYAELAQLCVPAMHELYKLTSREGEIVDG